MVYKGKYWISEKNKGVHFRTFLRVFFYASTQIMKWLRVVIRVPTSTHSKFLIRVTCHWFGWEYNLQKNIVLFFQMLSYNRVNCRKKVFIDAMQALIPDPIYMVWIITPFLCLHTVKCFEILFKSIYVSIG